jgi:hypothetical protein
MNRDGNTRTTAMPLLDELFEIAYQLYSVFNRILTQRFAVELNVAMNHSMYAKNGISKVRV